MTEGKPARNSHPPLRPPSHSSRRKRYLLALAGTVILGLASRLRPIGWYPYDKSLGDALYAVAVYLALALVRPRWRIALRAGAALGFCLAVESFQLTGIPSRYASIPPVRWLLGTHFAWHDIACYFVGIAAVALLDCAWLSAPRVKSAGERSII